MAVPLILMAAGTGLQVASGWAANWAKGKQELENAKWLNEQADFARDTMFRAIKRTEVQYGQMYGAQASAYAAGGVDTGSGSALNVLGNTLAASISELAAVRKEGEMNIKLARSRANLAEQSGQQLQSFGMNFIQGAGTAMSNYASTQGFGQGFPSWMTPTGKPPSFLGGGQGGSYLYGNSGGYNFGGE